MYREMAMLGVESIVPLKGRETHPFWKFQLQNFVQAKGSLGHFLGTEPKPRPDKKVELAK